MISTTSVYGATKGFQNLTVNNAETDKGFVIGVTGPGYVTDLNGTVLAFVMQGHVLRALSESSTHYVIRYGTGLGYVDKSYCVTGEDLTQFIVNHPFNFTKTLVVTTMETAVTDSTTNSVLYKAAQGEELTCLLDAGDSYQIVLPDSINYTDGVEKYGCVKKSDVKCVYRIHVTDFSRDDVKQAEKIELKTSGNMNDLIEYACSFVGNPYVWGGTDPNTGADCSGFVQYVYRHYGYNLPRTSSEQSDVGTTVSFSELQPGDLVFYTHKDGNIHHVSLYIGGGKVVHARGKAYGICITDWNVGSPAWAKRII